MKIVKLWNLTRRSYIEPKIAIGITRTLDKSQCRRVDFIIKENAIWERSVQTNQTT